MDRTYRIYKTCQGWGGGGSANFLVDWGLTKLRQMGLQVLSWLFPMPLKEVAPGLGDRGGEGPRGSWWVGRGEQVKLQSNAGGAPLGSGCPLWRRAGGR